MLLEPSNRGEIERLRQDQLALQAQFGGTAIENVHLTCERFVCENKALVADLIQRLDRSLTHIAPLALTAVSMKSLYASVLKCYVLKWEIEVSEELEHLVGLVKKLLAESEIASLYAPDFISSGVSALKGLAEPVSARLGAPRPLFTASRMLLSRILAPNEFEILATIDLPEPS